MQVTANHRPSPKSMSGNLEEIPLPDLLQLLSTSRKSGVLVLRSDWGVGRIFFRKGQIYFATIQEMAQWRPARRCSACWAGIRACSSWSRPTIAPRWRS
jgi:hypothetical protein